MKKILSILLAATIVLGSFALSISSVKFTDFTLKASAETVNSGSCGENATWSYNESTKTLTISGSGKMDDYEEYAAYTYPWRQCPENAENIVIGNGITNIGVIAFAEFTALKNVTIASTVTSIGSNSFYGCTSLESITLPDSVTSIGYGAFENCKSLKNINISDNVTDIGNNAFNNTGYYNNESNWENDVLYIKHILIEGKKTINGNYKIKDGTKIISGHAFSFNKSLVSITVPESVISIENYAFYECTALKSITISNSVTSIGTGAFEGCNSLTDVYYKGSEEEWKVISIAEDNNSLLNATIHFEENDPESSVPDEPASPSDSQSIDTEKLLIMTFEFLYNEVIPLAGKLIAAIAKLILTLIK